MSSSVVQAARTSVIDHELGGFDAFCGSYACSRSLLPSVGIFDLLRVLAHILILSCGRYLQALQEDVLIHLYKLIVVFGAKRAY